LQKEVDLDWSGEDRYSRLVCKVLLPDGDDASLDQVKAGMALHYKQPNSMRESRRPPTERPMLRRRMRREEGMSVYGPMRIPYPIQPQNFRHGSESPFCFDKENHRIACREQYHGPVRGTYERTSTTGRDAPITTISGGHRVEFADSATAQQAGYRAARNCP
jgi:hypothetical protein